MFGLKKKKEEEALRQWVVNWKPDPHTPDYYQFENRPYQIIFIYNELMLGCHKHEEFITQDTGALGTAFTIDYRYAMYRKNLGQETFPFVLEREPLDAYGSERASTITTVVPGRVKGELYAFKPPQVKELDKYMQNGVEFERKRVKTVIFYYKHSKETDTFIRCAYIIRAWMYMGKPDYWTPLLDGGYNFSLEKRYPSPERYTHLHDYYHFNNFKTNGS